MAVVRRPPLVLMVGGSSLSDGRLCTPPIPWTDYLQRDMTAHPSCKGEVIIINTGKGSQTSAYGASEAALMAPLRPSHVLMEDFGINDCAIGPVSIPQATINFNAMVASYLAAYPGVIIVHQTMSPASANDANRTNLATYYANGTANATAAGLLTIDNYATWPKPLDPNLTVPTNIAPDNFAVWGPTETLNPADKGSHLTLSNSNLTMTRSSAGGSWQTARGTVSKTAGKWYYEAVETVGLGCYFGIANNALNVDTDYVGADPGSVGYRPNGEIWNNGASIGSAATWTTNDTVGIAVDLDNHKIWCRKLGGAWNAGGTANPSTNVGGYAIPAGTYFPGFSSFALNDVATGTFFDGDGLHPIWANAFQLYSYPNILAWAISAMQSYWSTSGALDTEDGFAIITEGGQTIVV